MQASSLFRLAEVRISQSLSLRKKFLYDLSVLEEDETEQPDAVMEMERFVRWVVTWHDMKWHDMGMTKYWALITRSLVTGGEVVVLGAARGPAGRLVQNMFKVSRISIVTLLLLLKVSQWSRVSSLTSLLAGVSAGGLPPRGRPPQPALHQAVRPPRPRAPASAPHPASAPAPGSEDGGWGVQAGRELRPWHPVQLRQVHHAVITDN